MAEYKVVVAGTLSQDGVICGANVEGAYKDYQSVIDKYNADGWDYVDVFNHTVTGKLCCVIPDTKVVNLVIFKR